MNLQELQQVKKDIDNNVIVSKTAWLKVLNAAIAAQDFKQGATYNFPKDQQTYTVPKGMGLSFDEEKHGIKILGYNEKGDFVCEMVEK